MTSALFEGDAPTASTNVFQNDKNATVYYLPGTSGWRAIFGGRYAFLWNPEIQSNGDHFGVRTNRFGFGITGATNLVVVVEARTPPSPPALGWRSEPTG